MNRAEWALLLVLSVLWGGSFFFVEIAVQELPPLTIVAARVTLAAGALLAVGHLTGLRMSTDWHLWTSFLVMGLLNNAIPFTLIASGQVHIGSGVASILNATTPLFTVAVAHVFTHDEKLTGGRVAGVVVGLVGVAAMVGAATIQSMGMQVAAQLAVLAAAISYALAAVYGRRFKARGVSVMATATGQVAASSIMLLPLVLVVDRPWELPTPSIGALAAVCGLALLSTAAAYLIYFRLLSSAGATNLLLVTFLIPVSAMLLGVAVLGETLLPRHLVGMLFIGLGLVAMDGRAYRLARQRLRREKQSLRTAEGADPGHGAEPADPRSPARHTARL